MDSESAVLEISSDEGGLSESDDAPFDWLAELLDRSNHEGIESEKSDDFEVVDEVSCSSTVQKQNCMPSEGVKDVSADDSDDDCLVLDADPDNQVSVVEDRGIGSDDLLIVSEKGPIACRDYPHPRHLCATFPFSSTPHEKHCHLCHCYVCDSKAPCIYWGSGISSRNHCHSTDKEEIWQIQRQCFKQGNSTAPPMQKLLDATLMETPPQCNLEPLPFISEPLRISLVSRKVSISGPTEPRPCSAVRFSSSNGMSHRHDVHSRPFHGRSGCDKYTNRQLNPVPCINRQRRGSAGNLDHRFAPPHSRFKRAGPSFGALTAVNRSGYDPTNINQDNRMQARIQGPQVTHRDHSRLKRLQDILGSVELESDYIEDNYCNTTTNNRYKDMPMRAVSSQAQRHSHVPPQTMNHMHQFGSAVMDSHNLDPLDNVMFQHPSVVEPQLLNAWQPKQLAVMQADHQHLLSIPRYSDFTFDNWNPGQPIETSRDLLFDLDFSTPPPMISDSAMCPNEFGRSGILGSST